MEDKDIKNLRLEFGLSQERFARLLGVSLQTVRRWEVGLTRPLPIINLKLEELQSQTSEAQRKKGGIPMSERRKKSGEPIDFGLGGVFKGIGNLLDLVSKMTEEGKEEYTRTGEIKGLGDKAKGVYGFSVKVGLGGKPVIKEFGNIQATEDGTVVAEAREPLVDVLDEGDHLMVIAELPGVKEGDINLKVKEDVLELTAETKDRKYSKELLLPCPVDDSTMDSSYRNGILEIKLAKKK